MSFVHVRRPVILVAAVALVIAAAAAVVRFASTPVRAQTVGTTDLRAVEPYEDGLAAAGITIDVGKDPGAAAPLEDSFFKDSDHLDPVLVSFTDCHMGTGDLDKTGCVANPTYEDRDAWLVVYPNAQFPIFGPIRPDESEKDRPTSYTAPACTFVDAKTGKILFTVSA